MRTISETRKLCVSCILSQTVVGVLLIGIFFAFSTPTQTKLNTSLNTGLTGGKNDSVDIVEYFLRRFQPLTSPTEFGVCPSTDFDGGHVFDTGATSLFVLAGDLNYDGKRDLVTASDQGLSVLIGDGNGRFASPMRTLISGLTNAIDRADLNNDGVTDLVVTTIGSSNGSVTVLFGSPNGDFNVANTVSLSGNPQTIRVGDFNADDKPDLAVAQSGTNSVAVFLGTGLGSFTTATSYPIGANGYGLVVGDFNNDGNQDMIASSLFNQFLSFFAGRGDGTFVNATAIPTPQNNRNIEAGDFNADGKSDLVVVTNTFSFQMMVLLGNNDGTFNPQPAIDFAARPNQIAVSDVNNDGKLDLVSSGGGSTSFEFAGSASVRLGNGDATFGNESVFATGATPSSVAVDDFDIDGKTDLAIASLRANDVAILRGDGSGKFGAPLFPTGGTQANWSATGDFNNDGKPDIAVANRQSRNVSILIGTGNGGFNPPTLIPQQFAPNVIATTDINLDGNIDIVTGNAGNINNNATLFAHLGNGDGTFGSGTIQSTTVAREFHSIAVAKITNDNLPDLVFAGTESVGRVVVFVGNGNGSFGFIQSANLDQPVLHVATGDFNGDGRTDVAATTSVGVAILLNQPNGTLGPATYFRSGLNSSHIATGDFNEDSILDLAIANDFANGTVSILLGNGVGGFNEPTAFTVGNGPSGIAVRDLNADNHLDLAVANSNSNLLGQNKISVLYGSGGGGFGSAKEFIAGRNPRNVVVADFDLSGKPDLASPNFSSNDVAVLKNSCFSPVSYSFPTVSLSGGVNVNEPVTGTTNVTFNATLSAASSRPVKVKYYTGSLTATGTQDYQPASGLLVFQPGEITKTITIAVKSDTVYEYNEMVDLHLSDPTNVTLVNGRSSITIIDDDSPPNISIGDVTQAEGNSGTTNFGFPVTVSAYSERPIAVSFSTVGGTATSNVDFAATNGLLTIPSRVPSGTINVPVIGDFGVEPNEGFSVVLSDPFGATILDGQGTGTITNDDIAGSIQFGSATYSVVENAVNVTLTVTRTGGVASGISVQYATGGGTAVPDQDYRSAIGTLTFGANEASKTIVLTVTDDGIDEFDETFNVTLSNPTGGATIGTPSLSQVTILDNDPPPNLTIGDLSIAEGNSGLRNAVFTVRLSATSGRTVTVDYASVDGTATAGNDYQNVSGTVTFAPSTLNQTISVPIIGDTAYEPDETFVVNLGNPSNAVIVDGQGLGTIVNDDPNPAGVNSLISVNRFGTGSGNDASTDSVMTPDGQFVAFVSLSDDLVPNDTNSRLSDVFVRNTQTGTTTLVSVNMNGTGSGNGRSSGPVISSNGRYILFTSLATDLAPNDTNPYFDVYLRDMQAGTTTLVSFNSAGTSSATGSSSPTAISANGRYVIFVSRASDLTNVPDPSGSLDVFIRDLQTGVTKMLSVNISGAAPINQDSFGLPNSVTNDGRFVLFESDATNLTNVPDFGLTDVFLRDNQTNTTIPITVNRLRTQMVGTFAAPSLTADERFVCFSSPGDDIVPNDNNGRSDVFVRDLQNDSVTLVSVNSNGTAPGNAASDQTLITPDGRFVAFRSTASDLTGGADTNGLPDIFIRDLQNGTTRLISHNIANTNSANDFSSLGKITPNGRFVAFQSYATNMVSLPDTNAAPDVFVKDLQTNRMTLVSVNDFGTSAANFTSGNISMSTDGTTIVFQSDASNVVVSDNNGNTDIFLNKNTVRAKPVFDYDGDSKTDYSIFRPGPGEWWYRRSSDGLVPALQFGSTTDKIVPGDYTGDGKTDIAFFRPSNSNWFILRSEDLNFFAFPFGAAGDVPAPADYDGDGKTDAAVFRPSTATWFVNRSTGGTTFVTFGAATDKPVPADYDGDGKADIAIFRPVDGTWWYLRSSDGQLRVYGFGSSTDRPVPGDYTGDGKADVAFFRPSNANWFILRSEDLNFFAFPFGASTDIPAPGDYDGDGRIDAAVFRPSGATWFVLGSTSGTMIATFGTNGDIPTPNAYVP